MSDWGAPDVRAWKEDARALQQSMFLRLGDREWDEWRKSDRTILYRKVGFGLFSLPEDLPDEDNVTGYSKEQYEKIKRVSDVILRNAESGRFIRFACIFVFGKMWAKRFVIPVFKVKGDGNQTLFVDSDCRVYDSWRDYLDTNRLPKCMYCYPRNGRYQVDEDRSDENPGPSISRKFLEGTDNIFKDLFTIAVCPQAFVAKELFTTTIEMARASINLPRAIATLSETLSASRSDDRGGSNEVLVDFGTSPACDLVNRVTSFLDTTATAVSFVSSSVLAASLLTVPIAAPAIVAAQAASATVGIYGATRSVTTLVDRHTHDQSINPADSAEARNAWLGILGSALGSAQSRMYSNITQGAEAGNIGSRILAIAFNVVTVGNLTVQGMGILNGFISLVHKADRGTLTPLDIHQFATSFLFYSNSLLTASTTRQIIEDVQRDVLNRHAENLTPRQIEELFRRFDQAPGRTRLQRNANNIRSIRNIENRRDFFRSLATDWDEDDQD